MEKDTRTLKIFMACAIGAGIGTILALKLGRYFWPIGCLIGGLVGYVSYEIKKVIFAILMAYRYACKVSGYQIQLNWKQIKRIGLAVGAFLSLGSTFLVSNRLGNITENGFLCITAAGLFFASSFGMMILAILIIMENGINELDEEFKFALMYCNPISLCCYVAPKYTILGMWIAVKWTLANGQQTATFARTFVWLFGKKLFLLIHSDERLLCGVDALIGGAIGYFSGNIIAGMISGGVLGVVNYEIVSKRLLHLVPQN